MTRQSQKRSFSSFSFFNRRKDSQNQKNNQSLNVSSSKENLLSNRSEKKFYDSRNMDLSSMSKMHIKTNGSILSIDQLNQASHTLISGNGDALESKRTLNSDGSSGTQLQLILEKLIVQESKENFTKKLDNDYQARTPPLQESRVSYNSSPNHVITRKQEDEPMTPNSQTKFRFEMVIDPNEQAKLLPKTRKNKRKRQKRADQQKSQNRRLFFDKMVELQVNSDGSVSSCSLDSFLDDCQSKTKSSWKASVNEPQYKESTYFGNFACRASQLAYDIKAAFVNSYGLASTWVLGSCFPISKEEGIRRS